MYGFGYAAAEDRLWVYDLLRNLGRGRLSEFLGPAASFYEFDASLAVVAGYDEDELTAMAASLPQKFGALGTVILDDVDAEVPGINAYIGTLPGPNRRAIPPEYWVLKKGGFPPPSFDLRSSSPPSPPAPAARGTPPPAPTSRCNARTMRRGPRARRSSMATTSS